MKSLKFSHIVISLSIIISMVSCSNNDESFLSIVQTHIVFIGLDGWGGHDFPEALNHMPHIRQYIEEGVYTDKKLAVVPTVSGPNWATIFMGTTPDVHGYIEWDSKGPSEPYTFEVKNNIFPTISQALRRSKPNSEIGVFCEWGGIKYLVDSLSASHYCQVPLSDINSHFVFTDSVTSYIKSSKPTLCTIIYDDPDHAGHKSKFFSEEYYSILEKLDECISKIVLSVKDAGYYDNTVFIITSDHGGLEYNHGSGTLEEKLSCFVMWGEGIRKNYYAGANLEQQDIALIMAKILDIDIPSLWTGKSHDVFFN